MPHETLLEKVSQGLPPEILANLQETVIAQNVAPDDEIFLIAWIISTRTQMLNDTLSVYPDKLDTHTETLTLWTQEISQLTKTLKAETRDLSLMTQSSKRLIVILSKFLDSTTSLAATLKANNQSLIDLSTAQQTSLSGLDEKLNQLTATLTTQQQAIWELKQAQSPSKSWMSGTSGATSSLVHLGMSLGIALLVWFTFTEGKTLATKVDWSLTKLRRVECGLALRPANTPECHSIR